MTPWRKLEYAGWGFYGLTTAALSPVFVYLAYTYSGEDLQPMGKVLLGIFVAGSLAAVITTIANSIIVKAADRRELRASQDAEKAVAERRLAKKLRRKEKKQHRAGKE